MDNSSWYALPITTLTFHQQPKLTETECSTDAMYQTNFKTYQPQSLVSAFCSVWDQPWAYTQLIIVPASATGTYTFTVRTAADQVFTSTITTTVTAGATNAVITPAPDLPKMLARRSDPVYTTPPGIFGTNQYWAFGYVARYACSCVITSAPGTYTSTDTIIEEYATTVTISIPASETFVTVTVTAQPTTF
ncbi:hypothetical protein G7Y89_g4837 [Cudoniella acicularis]|uniref:Uncharacterized protein n=1 Tax=Cudoniella acicularis TaxID=354080 RepID=A0A8H4W720_9HELO|nr:hypothetical protein G7Y89_g4837 [Cudoniella acicularis]